MPHYNVQMLEETLDGKVEAKIIRALTDAVVEVYGEKARELVVVEIFGIPKARWGRGGEPIGDETVADVTLNMREIALERPEIDDVPKQLIASITKAVVSVFGDSVRENLNVLIVGIPKGRSGVAGEVV
jgi:phenylpyruvate tautomerase PptA (4-oxalocrotonate tautomerase family)